MLAFLSPPRASDIIWLAPIKRRATHISTRVSSIFLLISEEIGMYSGLYVNCVCVCECVCVCVCFVFCESWISEPVTGSPFWIPPNSLAKVACSAAIVCPPHRFILWVFCVPFAFIIADRQSATRPWKYNGLFKHVSVFVFPVFLHVLNNNRTDRLTDWHWQVIPVFKTCKCQCQKSEY
jgi:hypothetical protein